jgi:hypothetical protein
MNMRKFGEMTPAEFVDGCDNPAVIRGTPMPATWDAALDPCKVWKIWPVSTFADASTFSAAPASGAAPLSTVLTWHVTGVDSCAASGSWVGDKATQGTQTIAGLNASARYTLTCNAASVPGSAVVRWTPPTHNTDGSLLTDLAGFAIQYGTDPNALNLGQDIPLALALPVAGSTVDRQFVIKGLAPGKTYYFTMTAYAKAGMSSARTDVVNKAVPAPKTYAKAVDVAITAPTVPKPPSLLMVRDVLAWSISPDYKSFGPMRLSVQVGTVALSTPCIAKQRILGTDYYAVPKSAVKFNVGVTASYVVAKCG